MTAVPFPFLSAPGRHPQAAGGRLVNCYPEQLPETAGQKYIYWRVPGLRGWGEAGQQGFRGALVVAGTLYAVFGNTAYSFTSAGGAGTALTGTVPGTAPVIMARDNAAVPHIVIVAPGDGAVIINGTAVESYPDADVGQPNSVCYMRGFFHFGYGNGVLRCSDVNSLSINSLSQASAESKPDGLFRTYPLGNGQLLAVGSDTMEVWGGQVNDTGYPWSYIATIPRGIIGPYAITGADDGWGKGLYFVGDDNRVSRLEGYTPVPVSSTDVELAIEGTSDKTQISVSAYVAQGHGFVVVRGPTWCWEFDTTLQSWHERQSYLKSGWNGLFPVKAFDKWLCGIDGTAKLSEISGSYHDENGDPLRMTIETGPLGSFPKVARINEIELYLTKGVGIATGTDPVQTQPKIGISVSLDGGNTWKNERQVDLGGQALTNRRVRSSIWGQADVQGVRWRFTVSSNVPVGLMGADMKADVLQ